MTGILIIENYPRLSQVFTRILQRKGYSTDIAETTVEALEKLKGNSYRAVVIDDESPSHDGRLILRHLGEYKTRKIVITDSPQEAFLLGADACLKKIVSPDELLRLVEGVEDESKDVLPT
ncbi:MAG: response regulator [Candidatus Bathyarchaeota archaeon]|nr:response regulator [Candidatus Bathyarchaeota archaeon]